MPHTLPDNYSEEINEMNSQSTKEEEIQSLKVFDIDETLSPNHKNNKKEDLLVDLPKRIKINNEGYKSLRETKPLNKGKRTNTYEYLNEFGQKKVYRTLVVEDSDSILSSCNNHDLLLFSDKYMTTIDDIYDSRKITDHHDFHWDNLNAYYDKQVKDANIKKPTVRSFK